LHGESWVMGDGSLVFGHQFQPTVAVRFPR
jgi:hypothetical protein